MQEYKNDKLVVRYDPAICIHAGECVRGLPSVFSLSRKPWIDVNGAPAAAIIEQVKCCPSGALSYEWLEKAELGRCRRVPKTKRAGPKASPPRSTAPRRLATGFTGSTL